MHIKTECISCLIERGVFECKLAIKDEKIQIECMCKFCEILSREIFKNSDLTPSYIGTFRDRIIKGVAKNDYYYELKKRNNKIASEIWKNLKINNEINENEDEELKFLLKCVIAGNAMEYGVKGNAYMCNNDENNEFINKFSEILEKNIDLDNAIREIKKAKKILYLADNNGEIVFDSQLINFLVSKGKEVTLAIKSENIMDDFSFNDLKNFKNYVNFNLDKKHIISCGNFIGQYFESAPLEFIESLKNSDLVIAKGMANFETLEEEYKKFKIKKKTLYLLTAKCQPIADELNVERYSLVAKILY